ncbi:MAG: DUF1365 domain-containing protein [Acetobacteraceae bacterium]|nr:DUF1365 domain-containing protein [Acetobacteraceae bacterium]
MSGTSALYVGAVTHRRLRPRPHRMRYRVFSLLLDLDELPALHTRLRLFSHKRFNLFGFDERDHADGTGAPLRGWVERHLADAGIDLAGGPIRLLAMPRVLGYGFNPLSVYFCHHRDGRLVALLHQVHNTFGERHSYLIPVTTPETASDIRQDCAKTFHVSPFMAMDMRYEFRVRAPDAKLNIVIRGTDANGPIIVAAMAAEQRELTDAALLGAFLHTPLLTLKVILGIHWEALRLWRKGLRLHGKPPPPAEEVSIVTPQLPQEVRPA